MVVTWENLIRSTAKLHAVREAEGRPFGFVKHVATKSERELLCTALGDFEGFHMQMVCGTVQNRFQPQLSELPRAHGHREVWLTSSHFSSLACMACMALASNGVAASSTSNSNEQKPVRQRDGTETSRMPLASHSSTTSCHTTEAG